MTSVTSGLAAVILTMTITLACRSAATANSLKRAGRSPSASALQGATGLASVVPLIIGTVREWLRLKRWA